MAAGPEFTLGLEGPHRLTYRLAEVRRIDRRAGVSRGPRIADRLSLAVLFGRGVTPCGGPVDRARRVAGRGVAARGVIDAASRVSVASGVRGLGGVAGLTTCGPLVARAAGHREDQRGEDDDVLHGALLGEDLNDSTSARL